MSIEFIPKPIKEAADFLRLHTCDKKRDAENEQIHSGFKSYFSGWQRRNAEMHPVVIFKGQSIGISSSTPMNYTLKPPYSKLTNI